MKGLTEEPEPNQKGELMCKMLLDNSFEGCKLKVEDNFNSIETNNFGADLTFAASHLRLHLVGEGRNGLQNDENKLNIERTVEEGAKRLFFVF